MPQLAYVDGRIVPLREAGVSVEDRGLQFGDAIYEVCAVLNGRLLDWPLHLIRLRRNLAALFIDLPMTDAALGLIARRLLAANRQPEALLYIQVSRGTARRDHPGFEGAGIAGVLLGQDIGEQAGGLQVDPPPAHVVDGDDGDPGALLRQALREIETADGHHQCRAG